MGHMSTPGPSVRRPAELGVVGPKSWFDCMFCFITRMGRKRRKRLGFSRTASNVYCENTGRMATFCRCPDLNVLPGEWMSTDVCRPHKIVTQHLECMHQHHAIHRISHQWEAPHCRQTTEKQDLHHQTIASDKDSRTFQNVQNTKVYHHHVTTGTISIRNTA